MSAVLQAQTPVRVPTCLVMKIFECVLSALPTRIALLALNAQTGSVLHCHVESIINVLQVLAARKMYA